MGNPQVSRRLPIPEPVGTRTCDPHRFTRQNKPKNMENGGEMGEIHPISMIFMKLAVSHSVLHQKNVLGLVLKVVGRRIATHTHTRRYPYL